MSVQTKIAELVKAYNLLLSGIEQNAINNEDRAYGGSVRSEKGTIVENFAKHIINLAWEQLGMDEKRISLAPKKKSLDLPLNPTYLKNILIPQEVRDYIHNNITNYIFRVKSDVHVLIDDKLVMAVECKAYAENAMIKRILTDFTLFKHLEPNIDCVLFQLESQLGGDYSDISKSITYGSNSTHTLMSYFDVNLQIITLLQGERKVDAPIHKKEFNKKLSKSHLTKVVDFLLICYKSINKKSPHSLTCEGFFVSKIYFKKQSNHQSQNPTAIF